MRDTIETIGRNFAAASIFVFAAAGPAHAGSLVPGPLLGAGAPALALFAAGYYLIRKRRSR